MISFIQEKHGVVQLINQFAATFNIPIKNNRIEIPGHMGKGFWQLEYLPNGLIILVFDYTLYDDFFYERPPGSPEVYTLRSKEVDVKETMVTKIDEEELRENRGLHKNLYLTSSLFDISFFISKNTPVTAVHIELSKEWLAKYLHMDVYDDILREYLSMKIKMMDAVIVDADYDEAITEIIDNNKQHPASVTKMQNRVMYVIERFFTELYEQRKQIKYRIRNNSSDIEAIIAIENKLAGGVKENFPSVNQLAKDAGMSASKLKTLFRKIYGKALFEYYQERRMLKAKKMLLSANYSVKETALELGFKNISNFTLAFKKQFNNLPHEYTRRGK